MAFDQQRVPPDMIDVEMGADHGVDRLARMTGGGEISQKTCLQPVPSGYSAVFLIVAETSVDDDASSRGFDDERLNTHLQAAALISEIRLQPTYRKYSLVSRLGQDEPATASDFEFDDLGDRDLADPPLHDR